MREAQPRHAHQPEDVRLDHRPLVVLVDVLDRVAAEREPGVVDEDVDGAELLDHPLDEALGARAVAHVDVVDDVAGTAPLASVARAHADAGAVVFERARRGRADPARRARHDRRLAVEGRHGGGRYPVTMTGVAVPRLVRRAQTLTWIGNTWHVAEFAIAMAAGIAAGSIALIGFGVDSLVEGVAGFILVWRLARGEHTERRAQQLIAGSFFVVAAFVGFEAVRTLIAADAPEASPVGIALAAFTAATMPLLARAKRRVGNELGSSATVNEAAQTRLCAYMSVALLVGLVANAAAGWWWADPLAALVIAAVALQEGVRGWRGESCDDCC